MVPFVIPPGPDTEVFSPSPLTHSSCQLGQGSGSYRPTVWKVKSGYLGVGGGLEIFYECFNFLVFLNFFKKEVLQFHQNITSLLVWYKVCRIATRSF